MDHQGWHVQILEQFGHVHGVTQLEKLSKRFARGGVALVSLMPGAIFGVAGQRRGEQIRNHRSGCAPLRTEGVSPQAPVGSFGVGQCRQDPCARPIQDEPIYPVGIGGGEQDGHRSAFGSRVKEGVVDAGVVHDGFEVFDPFVDAVHLGAPGRRPGPTFVEMQVAAHPAEPVEHIPKLRSFPCQLDTLRSGGNTNYRRRSVAPHLIGQPRRTVVGELDGWNVNAHRSPPRQSTPTITKRNLMVTFDAAQTVGAGEGDLTGLQAVTGRHQPGPRRRGQAPRRRR